MANNRRKIFPSKKLFWRFIINLSIFFILSLSLFLFQLRTFNTFILMTFTLVKVFILICWAVSFFHLIQIIIESKFTKFFERMKREIEDIVINKSDKKVIFRKGGFIDWNPHYLNQALEKINFYHNKSDQEFDFLISTLKSSLKNKNYSEFQSILNELKSEDAEK